VRDATQRMRTATSCATNAQVCSARNAVSVIAFVNLTTLALPSAKAVRFHSAIRHALAEAVAVKLAMIVTKSTTTAVALQIPAWQALIAMLH
jgi:hypothetical protein